MSYCEIRVSEPFYYHREYKNDVGKKIEEPSWAQQCQRAATVALPFFSLYKPLSHPISLGMGTLRTFSSVNHLLGSFQQGNSKDIPYQLLQTTIAAVALGGTIFAHPVGMLVTTGQDIIIETTRLAGHLQRGDCREALASCANIVNNALYLALFSRGGLELTIASFATQIMLGLYHSHGEFQKGNYLEGMGHLVMAMIRGNQLAGQAQLLQAKWKFEDLMKKTVIKETDVGSVSTSEESSGNTRSKALILSSNAKSSSLSVENLKQAMLSQIKQGVGVSAESSQELIDILIKYGNNPDGIPVLHYSIKANDEKAVNVLIEHGASPFARDHQNRNCLYYAVESGNINLVKKFIALGVSPNEGNYGFPTAFTLAIEQQKNEVAKYLYEHGAQVYVCDSNYSCGFADNRGIAWEACFRVGNLEMVKFLIEKGAERRYEEDAVLGTYGFNTVASWLLMNSDCKTQNIRSERIACFKYLSDKKLIALPHQAEAYYQTMAGTYPEALEYLLDNHYFSPSDRFKNGYPIIFYACLNRDFGLELSEILIKRGADIKAKAWDQTLLYFIAPTGALSASEHARTKSVFSFLIKSGADLSGLLKRVGDDNFRAWLIAQGAK